MPLDWFHRRAEGSPSLSRRSLLRLAAGGVVGLSLPQGLALAGKSAPARAKNVLVILEQGGLSHIDTWDPKPLQVSDHRSPYKPISTRVAGMQFTELLAKTAHVADKNEIAGNCAHRLLCNRGVGDQKSEMLGSVPGRMDDVDADLADREMGAICQ